MLGLTCAHAKAIPTRSTIVFFATQDCGYETSHLETLTPQMTVLKQLLLIIKLKARITRICRKVVEEPGETRIEITHS